MRRDRDSNPGTDKSVNGFRDRPVQPLWHLSYGSLKIKTLQLYQESFTMTLIRNVFLFEAQAFNRVKLGSLVGWIIAR